MPEPDTVRDGLRCVSGSQSLGWNRNPRRRTRVFNAPVAADARG